jgi:L,D-transpeptidase YcbB
MIPLKKLAVLCLLFAFACTQNKQKKDRVFIRDTTITQAVSYNNLFLDSSYIDAFIAQNAGYSSFSSDLHNFYKERNYEYAWFDSTGLIEQGHTFYNLQNEAIAEFKDSSLFSPILDENYQQTLQAKTNKKEKNLQTELLFTAQFFKYANKIYGGSDINEKELGWFIPRKKINLQAALDTLLVNKNNTELVEPLNSQYRLLEKKLKQYYGIQSTIPADTIAFGKSYKLGDSSKAIALIRTKLFLYEDIAIDNNSLVFDSTLLQGIKQFQFRNGLPNTGLIGSATIKHLNTPIDERIKTILINMERARWLQPDTATGDRIVVNIPEYKMQVYEKGTKAFSMNVVVGTVANNTVIFKGNLKYVVFSPYWNVPNSIVVNEILPGIKKDRNYLAKHNMEITGYSNKIPIVRQLPGANNSLGRVKFLFPNSYNIYLHDTPFKTGFQSSKRSFSHGCVRLSEPKKLAQFLLRYDTVTYSNNNIDSLMNLNKEKWITIPPIPVTIKYLTAYVDEDGLLHFREDIYKHDIKMAEKLFIKQ